ncbi:hypothetical protein DQY98_20110 [Salmonella enterica subsp. enterica serovar Saintpaul]|nr:hypothetical protein [Salmonella enterica subsp. enterica serovar Saintpaul]EBX0752876.1 hypothetical protein [Salmonella enterica subsp. enterica serovar Saintpaul]ECB0581367.1 hypothetical protein [Salmonella enterica subsp. enterica serovar Saintpaul]ECI6579426.1 hypothetical protein [Salmonella enterica subsp. enterica serovar Saintpaul]
MLRLQITQLLHCVSDMPQPVQTAAGVSQIIAVVQQPDYAPMPDSLHGILLKEEVSPDAKLHVESAAGNGQLNVRVLVELLPYMCRVQKMPTSMLCLRTRRSMAQVAMRKSVLGRGQLLLKKGQHGEGDMLPVAVDENVTLLRHPPFRGFEAEVATGF